MLLHPTSLYNAITFRTHTYTHTIKSSPCTETSRRYFALDSLLLSSTYSLLCHGAIKMKIYCRFFLSSLLVVIGRGFKSFIFIHIRLNSQCNAKKFLLFFWSSLCLALTHFSTFPISFRNFSSRFYLFNILICTWEMEIIWVLIINDWGTFHWGNLFFEYKLTLKFDKLLIPRNWK